MKKRQWFIYSVNASPSSGMRSFFVGRMGAIIILIIALLGSLGLARCVYLGVSYSYAKLGMYYNMKENRQLKQKVQFLQRFAQEESTSISRIVAFEDKMRLKFGMEKISEDIRKAGVGGSPDMEELAVTALGDQGVLQADSIKEKLSALLRQTNLQDSTFNEVASYARRQADMWAQRPSISPVWGRITSVFGYRVHPFTGAYVMHEGLDISGPIGTPIKSSADGVISFVGFKDSFGKVVMIDHPASGFKTIFAHLNKAAVVEGQAVKRGDIIGYLGNSGRSTGPHLHYEVHKYRDLVNPMELFLPTDIAID
jgi:murein DD-endopeptidase MepM/ murein hydrolase activator NlpD